MLAVPSRSPFRTDRHLLAGGLEITITPCGFAVRVQDERLADHHEILVIEIYRDGRLLLLNHIATRGPAYRNSDPLINPVECGLWVKTPAGAILAALNVELDPFPFMRLQGEQQHVTENYVSVPPALTVTDEWGSVWTVGFQTAPKDKCPAGEFAFPVLRNGLDTGEIASRIERRGGKVRIFTAQGFKTWNGHVFF